MRAWQVRELGDPGDVLALVEVEPPTPGPGEVVIEVEAAALNFFDILLCQGKYQERPPLPFTPGAEVAGRVVATGDGVNLAPGRRVIAMPPLPRGGFAGRVAAPSDRVFPIPDAMPAEASAALHIAYQTAHFALHRRAGLRPGETVLVHAGAGGVGSAAIQLAVAAGARVLATAGGPEKVDLCRRLGADLAIDYRAEDFVAAVKGATGGRGADVIFDPVGGDVFDASRRCVAFEGRLVVIGFAGGRIADAPTNHALVKNYSIVGLHWGLYAKEMPRLIVETHAELLRLYESGKIDPPIYRVAPFTELPAALAEIGSRRTWGKLVTRPNG
ncbi:MAG: Putative Zn-dependent oxidoreductase PA5234 [uncultured Thermomicrobiales bacterium]|uniref:Zn-dependent oxidoreductase PA5234 n=1 Tax=uncultured Thermomicrobiales bacterium TaxID=1645740 RepID=A0A6J4VMZ8_9BACT|nr:MAG: Putative Zn-dependent oxidoreductase PA5234 [uncultured Thermomicrobiales bacterium]